MRQTLSTAAAALALTTSAVAGVVTTAGPSAASDPGTDRAELTVRERADRIMNLPYHEFARTPRVEPFNWTTDGCSAPTGYAPYSEVFRPACVQHDFGYRNYGGNHELKLSPTRETKIWIDGRFRTEMERLCKDRYALPASEVNCMNAAQAYHIAVSLGGDRAFF